MSYRPRVRATHSLVLTDDLSHRTAIVCEFRTGIGDVASERMVKRRHSARGWQSRATAIWISVHRAIRSGVNHQSPMRALRDGRDNEVAWVSRGVNEHQDVPPFALWIFVRSGRSEQTNHRGVVTLPVDRSTNSVVPIHI